jgi:hypothetical protein
MGIRESSEGAAKKLLKWGFQNGDDVTPIGTLLEPGAPLPVDPDPVGGTDPATGTDAGAVSTGTATTAAAPSQEPSTLPPAVLVGAVVLVAGGGAIALARRRMRPGGRHAA